MNKLARRADPGSSEEPRFRFYIQGGGQLKKPYRFLELFVFRDNVGGLGMSTKLGLTLSSGSMGG